MELWEQLRDFPKLFSIYWTFVGSLTLMDIPEERREAFMEWAASSPDRMDIYISGAAGRKSLVEEFLAL